MTLLSLLVTAAVPTLAQQQKAPEQKAAQQTTTQPSPPGTKWAEEPAEAPYAFGGVFTAPSPDKLSAELYFAPADGAGPWLVLRISEGRARFLAGPLGKLQPIGPAGALRLGKSEDGWEFTVQRRAWRLVFICDGRVVCRGWAPAAPGAKEKIGWRVGEGCGLEDDRVQPLGPIFAADDFARPASAEGTWEAATGKWAQRSLREDKQASAMDATKSTNPFSYFGQAKGDEGPALTATGYWFWTNYSIQAAVRAQAESIIGLAVCFQDQQNYLAVRWTSKAALTKPDQLELVAVVNGAERVLKRARGGFIPNQWFKLRLGYCDGHLVAWVDGQKRLEAVTDLFGQGQAALLADGPNGVFFDDIVIRDWEILRDDFAAPTPGKWRFESGKWTVTGGTLHVTSTDQATALTGSPAWSDVSVAVAARGQARAWGVMLGLDGSAQALVAVEPQDTPRLVIYRRDAQGRAQELAAATLAVPDVAKRWLPLTATCDRGVVRAAAGGVTVAAFVPGLHGRVALYASGARDLIFDDFAVSLVEPPPSAHVVKEFTDIKTHFEMVEWASRRHAWAPGERAGPPPIKASTEQNVWWTKGDYFGDYAFEIPIPGIGQRDLALTLVTDAEPGLVGTGVVVAVAGKNGEKALTVTVSCAGQQLASERVEIGGDQAKLTCRRNGDLFVVLVDDKPVFSGHVIPPPGKEPKLEKPDQAAGKGEDK